MFAKYNHIKSESLFILFSFSLIAVTVFALLYPPVLAEQGQAHRIFYMHVPVAWVALYTPILSAISGVLYLFKREERYDVWSYANAKLALIFSVGVVITGSLWASTEWGTYWNWREPRLMTFFVLMLAMTAYFLVREMTEDPRQGAVSGALMSLLSGVASIITWLAIRIMTPDTHPTSVLGSMSPKIKMTFWISVIGYHFFFLILLRLAVRQERIRRMKLRIEANMRA